MRLELRRFAVSRGLYTGRGERICPKFGKKEAARLYK